eukprot:TRINITY_DN10266_c0_g1_i1.p2 TRINITY_DN10266_c0_g1~~TRINITY_DN10266_c0_g1_i1.p2  ORF type:complete len:217 (-),score=44.44 TRINITY_DN10266_c0_g1_i1:1381-2031(-)
MEEQYWYALAQARESIQIGDAATLKTALSTPSPYWTSGSVPSEMMANALRLENADVLNVLLEADFLYDPLEIDKEWRSHFWHACYRGHLVVLRSILSKFGPKVFSKALKLKGLSPSEDFKRISPYEAAKEAGRTDVTDFISDFLNKEAERNEKLGKRKSTATEGDKMNPKRVKPMKELEEKASQDTDQPPHSEEDRETPEKITPAKAWRKRRRSAI